MPPKRTPRSEILAYSKRNTYVARHFADAVCRCGGRTFRVQVDDTVGAAVRRCASCRKKHAIGDSAEYLDEAELDDCACPCGNEVFEVTIGVALYARSRDVRWLYLGCRCTKCALAAVYADWKNEFSDYTKLLANV